MHLAASGLCSNLFARLRARKIALRLALAFGAMLASAADDAPVARVDPARVPERIVLSLTAGELYDTFELTKDAAR